MAKSAATKHGGKPKDDLSVPKTGNVHGLSSVLLALVNRGQFPYFLGFIIIMTMVVKMKPEDVAAVFNEGLHIFKEWHVLGWILNAVIITAWVIFARKSSKASVNEINRLTQEKEMLLQKILNLNHHNKH